MSKVQEGILNMPYALCLSIEEVLVYMLIGMTAGLFPFIVR